jgi:aminoglycoside phosphotransferase (APT) family kinase protein
VSQPALVDAERLNAWIGDRLPDADCPLHAERIGEGTGIGNALFLLRRGGQEWVLRRPPAVINAPGASDMLREWRILSALEGTPVPHPTPRLLCQDEGLLGAPFFLMDRIHGFTPGYELPPPVDTDRQASWDLAMAYVDGLVELSSVDWKARGLDGLGKPEGFLERQVPRWLKRPTMSPAGLIHGDYSPFNVMVAPDPPVRLAAIIDWDTGTIGDPLLDIGHLLARWTNPGEEPILDMQAGQLDAMPTRKEMAARYEERTGRDLSALAYYEVLALFKLGVILEGTYARNARAGVPEGDNIMAVLVPRLMRGAAAFARGERS